jgi:hypothetical protein
VGHVDVVSRDCNLLFGTRDADKRPSQAFRTLFMQEMIARGVIAPSFVVSFSHSDADIERTVEAAGELELREGRGVTAIVKASDVIGKLIGLGLMATINQRIGVMGGYSNVLERATGRAAELNWRWWFLFGVLGGSLVWRLLAGESNVGDGYGWLSRTFDDDAIVAAALFGGGILIGFGAKTAGGCTAGNGIGGGAGAGRAVAESCCFW